MRGQRFVPKASISWREVVQRRLPAHLPRHARVHHWRFTRETAFARGIPGPPPSSAVRAECKHSAGLIRRSRGTADRRDIQIAGATKLLPTAKEAGGSRGTLRPGFPEIARRTAEIFVGGCRVLGDFALPRLVIALLQRGGAWAAYCWFDAAIPFLSGKLARPMSLTRIKRIAYAFRVCLGCRHTVSIFAYSRECGVPI